MVDINKIIESLDWSKEPKGLYEPIGYALSAGGKRLRPKLCLLGAQIIIDRPAGCKTTDGCKTANAVRDVLPAALALEVFHNFTLLHDDVMDKAQMRRGRPCVHIRWNENTAILSGDQMLIEAYKLLSGVPADKLGECLRLFNEMATGICEGQQLDVDFEEREDVTIADYMEMIRLKTAVLLATALRMGGYIAGASEPQQQALYDAGIHLGLAFQIEDDLLDCYGDEKTFGKAIGGDIREGKKTFMYLTALQLDRCGAPVGPLRCKTGYELEDVLAEYDRLGVKQKAIEAIEVETNKALEAIRQLPDNDARAELEALAHKLMNRNI